MPLKYNENNTYENIKYTITQLKNISIVININNIINIYTISKVSLTYSWNIKNTSIYSNNSKSSWKYIFKIDRWIGIK